MGRFAEIGVWCVAVHEHDDVALPWLAEASDLATFERHHESPGVSLENALKGIAVKTGIDLATLMARPELQGSGERCPNG